MKTRDLVLIAVYAAATVAAQLALSFIAGVELVTVLLAAFCFYFGIKRGAVLVNTFCLLRLVIFGFFPTVVILYAVYFNLFALVFGAAGRACGKKHTAFIFAAVLAAVMSCAFTLLDDVITPLFYGFSPAAAERYFEASLITMGIQCFNAVVTALVLFSPIVRTLNSVYGKYERRDKYVKKQVVLYEDIGYFGSKRGGALL